MKKNVICVLIVLTICISSLFASTAKVFELGHSVYDEVEMLYVAEGKASPMGAKPWTGSDIARVLRGVNPSSETTKALWDRISSYLDDYEGSGVMFDAVLQPHVLLRSNAELDDLKYIVSSDKLDMQPAWFGLGYQYGNFAALYMDAAIGVPPADIHTADVETFRPDKYPEVRSGKAFATNIPALPDEFSITNFPMKAYLLIGNDVFRVISGRGQVEWGNGVMGNMILGNTLPYHDYLSLSFHGDDTFSYQLLGSFFSHSVNKQNGTDDRKPISGIRMFLGHRFEFTFFDGAFIMTLNDSVMYQSPDNYFDLRLLNPMFFLHNGYMAGNSNSLASLEIEYSPVKNLSLYAQVAFDDYAVPGEPKPGESGGSADGLGCMAGIRYSLPTSSKGFWHGDLEFVYTSPYMYHRAMEENYPYPRELYFVSSNRYYTTSKGQTFLERYLSFPFGSDAIVGQLRSGYTQPGLFSVMGSARFMAHGVIDEYSSIRQYKGGEPIISTPSTSNPLGEGEDKGGAVEYTLVLGLEGQYEIFPWLPVTAGINFVSVWNRGNFHAPAQFDVQLDFGITLKY